MLSDHEADGSRTAMEGAAVCKVMLRHRKEEGLVWHGLNSAWLGWPTWQSMELVADILAIMIVLMSGLRVFPERMRKNLDMTHGMIVTEHLMLVLGEYIGKWRHGDDLECFWITLGDVVSCRPAARTSHCARCV
jgi:hypothetical protein